MNAMTMRTRDLEKNAFLLLLAVVSIGFLWVVFPLFGAVMWAVSFAILFRPLNGYFAKRLGLGPTLASIATTLLVLLLVVLPGVITAGFIAQEAASVWRHLQSGQIDVAAYYERAMGALPRWLAEVLEGAGLNNLPALVDKVKQTAAQGTQPIAAQVWSIGQSTLDFGVSFFVMVYLLFFLLRGGDELLARIQGVLPLAPMVQQRLFSNFGAAIRSTVKGNVVVAAIQGALGGVAFMMLGIPGALLWAVVMAFLSLLPAIGAALVWGPVAIYLLMSGQVWQGVVLIAFGSIVIGLVDNVLRPILVGKETKMPDYVVLITTIGGMALFGINGFVIGPAIAAMFIAAWDELEPDRQAGHTGATPVAPSEPDPSSVQRRRRRKRGGNSAGPGPG